MFFKKFAFSLIAITAVFFGTAGADDAIIGIGDFEEQDGELVFTFTAEWFAQNPELIPTEYPWEILMDPDFEDVVPALIPFRVELNYDLPGAAGENCLFNPENRTAILATADDPQIAVDPEDDCGIQGIEGDGVRYMLGTREEYGPLDLSDFKDAAGRIDISRIISYFELAIQAESAVSLFVYVPIVEEEVIVVPTVEEDEYVPCVNEAVAEFERIVARNMAEIERAEALVARNRSISMGLDIVTMVGGATAGVSGAFGIAHAMNVHDGLGYTAGAVRHCNAAIEEWKAERVRFHAFTDRHFNEIRDFSEFQRTQGQQMNEAAVIQACENAFQADDYLEVQSEIRNAGIASGVGVAGGVTAVATSAVALSHDLREEDADTATQRNMRIGATVGSGVATVAGIVSTVLVNRVNRAMTEAKQRQIDCLSAMNELRL